MAALTADVNIPCMGPTTKHGVKAGVTGTFYRGALIYADATDGKAQITPAAGDFFLGICAKQKVVAATDEIVEIYSTGMFLLPYTSAAEANVGESIVLDIGSVQSDNPADLESASSATLAANDILVGKVLSIQGSSGWVLLDPGKIWNTDTGWDA